MARAGVWSRTRSRRSQAATGCRAGRSKRAEEAGESKAGIGPVTCRACRTCRAARTSLPSVAVPPAPAPAPPSVSGLFGFHAPGHGLSRARACRAEARGGRPARWDRPCEPVTRVDFAKTSELIAKHTIYRFSDFCVRCSTVRASDAMLVSLRALVADVSRSRRCDLRRRCTRRRIYMTVFTRPRC